MDKKKLKVLWICHFTNNEIQSYLPLWKKKDEFAPWIPNILKGFESRDDIDLFVVSPHEFLKYSKLIKIRNINYYFIPVGIPLLHRHWPRILRLDILSNFFIFNKKVKTIVKKMKPDLINLFGAENAYYSSSVFDLIADYPIIVSIQGFISHFKDVNGMSLELNKRIAVEEKILTIIKYFSGEIDSSHIISKYNPHHKFYELSFPVNEQIVTTTKVSEKIYDCLYVGKLVISKGSEDFIRIVYELKKKRPNIYACMIGQGNIIPLKDLASKLNLNQNINFLGFVESQRELFKYIKSSRVFLVPTHIDRLPSTIREAMFLKVPVIAYSTGGIPYINEKGKNICLVKTGDYNEMVNKTIELLENPKLASELVENAYIYAQKEFSLSVNVERFMNTYKEIINKESQN